MIHNNTWHPDTCECEIEYTWDDAQPEHNRVHTFLRIAKACSAHKGLESAAHYRDVHAENTHKNIALAEVVKALPSRHTKPVLDEHGNETSTRQLKEGLSIHWQFDKDRKLKLVLPFLDKQGGRELLTALADGTLDTTRLTIVDNGKDSSI